MRKRWIVVLAIVLVLLALPVLAYNGVLSLSNKTYGIFLCGGHKGLAGQAGYNLCSLSGVAGLDAYEYMTNVYYGGGYTTLHNKVTALKQQGYTKVIGVGYSAGADAFAYEMAHHLDDYYAVGLIGLPWLDVEISNIRQVKTNVAIINGGQDTTAVPETAYEWYIWLPDSITKDFKILAGKQHLDLAFTDDQSALGGMISQFAAGTYPHQDDTFLGYVNGEKVTSGSQVRVFDTNVQLQIQMSSKISQYFATKYGFVEAYEMPSWAGIGRLNLDTATGKYAGTVTLVEGSHSIALGPGNLNQIILSLDAVSIPQGSDSVSYLAISSIVVIAIVVAVMVVVLIRRHSKN